MKRKVPYPKGRLLLVHDCTVDICLSNNPGAILLSVLLFWYENPHLYDVLVGNDFTVCRTQASIEKQSCNQIDVKTIHDTAVPLLQLLGYLSVQEKMNGNLYTLHMDRIFAAFTAYEHGNLKAFLKAQLESAPIVLTSDELELALINKKWLYLQIERTLIQTRADSHCKRGRKPKTQAASEAEIAMTETYRESIERGVMREREEVVAVAPTAPAEMSSEDEYHFAGTEQQHLIWNCQNWCAVNHGTCEDYVAAIEAGLHESPTDKMPVVPPNVTPVSCSQPVYKQEIAQGDVTDATSLEGGTHDTGTLAAARALHLGGNPDAARAGTGGARRDHAQDGSETQATSGKKGVAQQTVSGLFPGAVPAHHSGRALDGAASTAPPRSGPRASGDHVPDTEKMLDKSQKGKRNGKAPHAPVPIPVEAQAILDDWDSLFKAPIPRTEKHVQAAADLVPCHPCRDDLKACKDWLFTTDRPGHPWFRSHGVKLRDVADNFGAWQSVQPTEPTEDELEPYSIPWFLAQQARRQAQELQA